MKGQILKEDRKGFTLVELIVVIAILAILAAVAYPVYNGYIDYTHKGVDRKTAGEVIQAIELANYDDPSLFENGGVVYISGPDGNGTTGVDTATNAALSNALGELSTVKLTYGGWGLESFSASIKTGFENLMSNTDSKANAYWNAVSDNGKTATFAADVDDLWEHFTALKNTAYWDADNVGKAVKMSNEKQDKIAEIWEAGTTFFIPEITNNVQTDKAWYALSMARNYSFAAYAEKSGNLTDNMKKELDAFKLSCGAFGSEQLTKDKEKTDTLQDSGWKDVIAAYYADTEQLQADALGYLAIMEAANVIADGKDPTTIDSTDYANAMEPHLATVSGTLTKGKSALEAAMAVTGENAQILVAKNADGTVTCKPYPDDLDPRDQSGSGNEEKSNAPTTVSTSATANFNAGTIDSNAGDGVIALNPDGSVLIQFNSSTIPNKQKVTKISVNGVEYTTGPVPLENGKIGFSIGNKSSSLTVIGGSQANVSEDVTIELTAGEDTYTLKFTLWTISE